jgi:hypothetical protein
LDLACATLEGISTAGLSCIAALLVFHSIRRYRQTRRLATLLRFPDADPRACVADTGALSQLEDRLHVKYAPCRRGR